MDSASMSTVPDNRICPKLESPCGNQPWGWCQTCPKRNGTTVQMPTSAGVYEGLEMYTAMLKVAPTKDGK